MKKIISTLLMGSILISFSACGKDKSADNITTDTNNAETVTESSSTDETISDETTAITDETAEETTEKYEVSVTPGQKASLPPEAFTQIMEDNGFRVMNYDDIPGVSASLISTNSSNNPVFVYYLYDDSAIAAQSFESFRNVASKPEASDIYYDIQIDDNIITEKSEDIYIVLLYSDDMVISGSISPTNDETVAILDELVEALGF